MARKNLNALFNSLFRLELKLTHKNANVKVEQDRIDGYKSILSNPPEGMSKEDLKSYKQEINQAIIDSENKIKEYISQPDYVDEFDVLLTKLTYSEVSERDQKVQKRTTEFIENYRKNNKEVEMSKLKLFFDSDGIFNEELASTNEGLNDVFKRKNEIIDFIVEQILTAEGFSEDWALNPDEDDPELEITKEQEEELRIDDRLPPDEQAKIQIEYPEYRKEQEEDRRQVVIEERTSLREERRKELHEKGYDSLLDILFNYKILSEANIESNNLYNDLSLYYAVKDPDSPIYTHLSGQQVIDRYERFFDSVEEVKYFRENYETFYNWLLENYNELQLVKTKEELERLVRSNLFR